MRAIPLSDGTEAELLTSSQAFDLAARFVGRLTREQVPPGSRLIFQAPNSGRLLASVLGALHAGFAPVVISDTLTRRERDELVSDVEPALVVDDALLHGLPQEAAGALGEHIRCRPMHFTSGTSGRPKAVWSGWLASEAAADLVAEEVDAWNISSDDTHVVIAPMSHSAPLRFPLMTLEAGGSVVVPPSFSAATVADLLGRGLASTTFMAPTHLQRLLDCGLPTVTGMRLVAHAGAPCAEHVRVAARQVFGDDALREFYGSTEGQFTICTPREFDAHPGTVGRARPGRALRIESDGRIWCRVPRHARFEYWGDPEKTAQTWQGDWFTVSDLGHLDDDDYLFLDGRRSDLIITGGVNVYPAEIERVLLDLPAVRQATAFSLPDDHWGQRVCVAIVGDLDEAAVRGHCARLLAPYKRPKSVYLVDELPLTHSGKVDRLSLPRFLGLAGSEDSGGSSAD